MATHHWGMLILVLIIGYVLGRYFPQPAQMVGLA